MLQYFCLAAILTFAHAQHNNDHHHVNHHTLASAVDAGFTRLDANKNGVLEQSEFDNVFSRDDDDGNGVITMEEFMNHTSSGQYASALYHYFDPDNNGEIEVASIHSKYNEMDHNHNGEVDRHEFDQYYTKLLEELINHHGHHISG